MTNVLFSLLAEWKGFWWLREKNRRLASFVRARIYGFQHAIRERKTESGIFAKLFKAVFWQLTWSVVIVAVFYWLDDKIHSLFVRWGLEIPMGDDSYTALLATVAGIGGLFVGLYYTALSTVSGAIYARVPNNNPKSFGSRSNWKFVHKFFVNSNFFVCYAYRLLCHWIRTCPVGYSCCCDAGGSWNLVFHLFGASRIQFF